MSIICHSLHHETYPVAKGANYLPTSVPGTDFNKYEKDTWPELERLARDVPEAGIHFRA
jgi:hypothetical protein